MVEKHESKFSTIGFCAKQNLETIGSQIEFEHIFSLASILTRLRKYWLQFEILDNWFWLIKIGPMILG
jgi:hypothetical protein